MSHLELLTQFNNQEDSSCSVLYQLLWVPHVPISTINTNINMCTSAGEMLLPFPAQKEKATVCCKHSRNDCAYCHSITTTFNVNISIWDNRCNLISLQRLNGYIFIKFRKLNECLLGLTQACGVVDSMPASSGSGENSLLMLLETPCLLCEFIILSDFFSAESQIGSLFYFGSSLDIQVVRLLWRCFYSTSEIKTSAHLYSHSRCGCGQREGACVEFYSFVTSWEFQLWNSSFLGGVMKMM